MKWLVIKIHSYYRNLKGNSEIDKAFQLAMQKFTNKKLRTGAFREIVASDEIVSNGPGLIYPHHQLQDGPIRNIIQVMIILRLSLKKN